MLDRCLEGNFLFNSMRSRFVSWHLEDDPTSTEVDHNLSGIREGVGHPCFKKQLCESEPHPPSPPQSKNNICLSDDKLPVIIAKDLKDEEKAALLKPLGKPRLTVYQERRHDRHHNDDNELIPTRIGSRDGGIRLCVFGQEALDILKACPQWTHWGTRWFTKVMLKYGVTHRLYLHLRIHPQTMGKFRFKSGLKRILERTRGEKIVPPGRDFLPAIVKTLGAWQDPQEFHILSIHFGNARTDNQEKDKKRSQNDKTELGMEKQGKDKSKSKPKPEKPSLKIGDTNTNHLRGCLLGGAEEVQSIIHIKAKYSDKRTSRITNRDADSAILST
ncbi:hypothetical protein Tco_1068498 [Tanacetum coccineum]|uniref:Uncharacterized protein n=1 Tax=Tanacetum coccineum TaxID=301880 RepID=A0ABQ5HG30_9ASTR